MLLMQSDRESTVQVPTDLRTEKKGGKQSNLLPPGFSVYCNEIRDDEGSGQRVQIQYTMSIETLQKQAVRQLKIKTRV